MKLTKIEPKYLKKHNPRIGLITLASDFRIEKDFNNVIYGKDIDLYCNRIKCYNPLTNETLKKMADDIPKVTEDIFSGSVFLNDIIRSDLILMDDAITDATGGKRNTDIDGTAILLEGSAGTVACRQEDGTQVATTFGDRILLEGGIGWNDQLMIDVPDRVAVEESINKGTIPFKNYTISNP